MEVLRLKLAKKSCENPFLVSFFILEVEGDSGIPVTPGIHPKTQVKRRARLFEAWKNDNRKATPKLTNKQTNNTQANKKQTKKKTTGNQEKNKPTNHHTYDQNNKK